MDILMTIWTYFATNILQQPAFMIGLIVLIGYVLLGKPWYDTLSGTLKGNCRLFDFDRWFWWTDKQLPSSFSWS